MSKTDGSTNGTPTTLPLKPIATPGELETLVARYRTALVALIALAKREGWHRQLHDSMLLEEIEYLLAEGATRGR